MAIIDEIKVTGARPATPGLRIGFGPGVSEGGLNDLGIATAIKAGLPAYLKNFLEENVNEDSKDKVRVIVDEEGNSFIEFVDEDGNVRDIDDLEKGELAEIFSPELAPIIGEAVGDSLDPVQFTGQPDYSLTDTPNILDNVVDTVTDLPGDIVDATKAKVVELEEILVKTKSDPLGAINGIVDFITGIDFQDQSVDWGVLNFILPGIGTFAEFVFGEKELDLTPDDDDEVIVDDDDELPTVGDDTVTPTTNLDDGQPSIVYNTGPDGAIEEIVVTDVAGQDYTFTPSELDAFGFDVQDYANPGGFDWSVVFNPETGIVHLDENGNPIEEIDALQPDDDPTLDLNDLPNLDNTDDLTLGDDVVILLPEIGDGDGDGDGDDPKDDDEIVLPVDNDPGPGNGGGDGGGGGGDGPPDDPTPPVSNAQPFQFFDMPEFELLPNDFGGVTLNEDDALDFEEAAA